MYPTPNLRRIRIPLLLSELLWTRPHTSVKRGTAFLRSSLSQRNSKLVHMVTEGQWCERANCKAISKNGERNRSTILMFHSCSLLACWATPGLNGSEQQNNTKLDPHFSSEDGSSCLRGRFPQTHMHGLELNSQHALLCYTKRHTRLSGLFDHHWIAHIYGNNKCRMFLPDML